MPEWSFFPVLHEDYYDRAATSISVFPLSSDELDTMPVLDAVRAVVEFNRGVRRRLGVEGVAPKGIDVWQFYTDTAPTT